MLDTIRTPNKGGSALGKAVTPLLILAFGVLLGAGAKVLDETPVNELPALLQAVDIGNFLSRFAIWIFLGVCLSVYSRGPGRAAVNVFLFFLGMVGSYYLYSALVAGFFPRSYALVWFGITAASPLLAFVCWYAKGEGWIAVVLSGIILGVLFSQAVLLFQGVRITHIPEVLVWLASLWVLRRKSKEFAAEIVLSIVVALVWQSVIPYWE